MEIWRTVRSSPGTSRMEARLVRLRCSVLTGKSCFVIAGSGVLCFALHARFCVRKCYQNRAGEVFHSRDNVFFFVSQFASEGKTDEGKEFMIAEGTIKVCFVAFLKI